MFTYDALVAVMLLTSSVVPPDMERVQPAVLHLAIGLEILDAREEQYLLGLSKDPHGDLLALRRRYEALQFAPPLAESVRLPPRKMVEDNIDANRAYRKELAFRLEVDSVNAEALRAAINEVDQLYHVWSLVRDIQCTYHYVSARRQWLNELRDVIGPSAFYGGELPPHLPYWHFPRLR
jgi:hypothetical protein